MSAPTPGARPRFKLEKRDRLLRRTEFLATQNTGRKLHAPHFVLALRDRADGAPARIGITASRKAANSVGRNRVRRLVREVFRTQRQAFPAGHDCVVIVRESVPDLTLSAVRDELLAALSKWRGRASGTGARPSPDTSTARAGGTSAPAVARPQAARGDDAGDERPHERRGSPPPRKP